VQRSEKVVFRNADGESLAASLELPGDDPISCALFAHCFTCSKDVAAASRISRHLAEIGVAVLRFDFTGLGNSEGDFSNTNFSSNVADLVAAADWLREERGTAPAMLVGHSLGGAAVIAAAGRIEEVRAVVTIGAPSRPQHVRQLLEESAPEIEAAGSAAVTLAGRTFLIKKQFLDDLEAQNLAACLRDLGRALLVMHAPRDEIVPVDEARRIFDAARHPKSFLSLDDADHLLTRPADSEYAARVLTVWASRYVLPEKAIRYQPSEPTRFGTLDL
jgi:putative redox protein